MHVAIGSFVNLLSRLSGIWQMDKRAVERIAHTPSGERKSQTSQPTDIEMQFRSLGAVTPKRGDGFRVSYTWNRRNAIQFTNEENELVPKKRNGDKLH